MNDKSKINVDMKPRHTAGSAGRLTNAGPCDTGPSVSWGGTRSVSGVSLRMSVAGHLYGKCPLTSLPSPEEAVLSDQEYKDMLTLPEVNRPIQVSSCKPDLIASLSMKIT